jgi:hypothetical protein
VAVVMVPFNKQDNPHKSLVTGKDAFHDVLQYVLAIEADIKAAIAGELEINNGGKLQKLTAADIRLALFARPRARVGVSLCIQNMFLHTLINLEKSSGLAGLVACLSCIRLVDNDMRMITLGTNYERYTDDEDLIKLTHLSRRSTRDAAHRAIRKYIGNPLTSSIALQACNMTGHSGQLYVDKEYTSSTSVELTSGYTFPVHIEENFALSTKTKEWKEFNVKTIIIDGIIESVGEINRILEYFHNEKRPGVIFARGFNDEVLGTLSVNKNRETLNVVPIVVPYDLEGINMLVDLAVVSNTDVISSLKGDVISNIDPLDLVTVGKIIATQDGIIISNETADARVRAHVNNILEQKNEASITDKKALLDKRTKALSSVCTNIKLSSDLDNRDASYLQIQHGINMFKYISRYGMIDVNDSINLDINNNIKDMLQLLSANGYHKLSAYELILGIKTGVSLANSILSTTTYLTLDDTVSAK